MNRLLTVVLAAGAVSGGFALPSRAASAPAKFVCYDTFVDVTYVPDATREAEIAAALPERPQLPGVAPSHRAAWEAIAGTEEGRDFIRRAEAAADEPIPELTDEMYLAYYTTHDRGLYERPWRLRRLRLDTLLVGEALEGKGRFLNAIQDLSRAMLAERGWAMAAHQGPEEYLSGKSRVDLMCGETSCLLTHVHCWFGDRIDPQLDAAIVKALRERMLSVYLDGLDTHDYKRIHWVRINNNWNAVCHASVVLTALALIEDRAVRARICAAAEFFNRAFVSGFPDDGYCTEGASYWNFGFGHNVMLGVMMREATQGVVDILASEKVRRAAAYAEAIQLEEDVFPLFADCGAGAKTDLRVWALMDRVWPELVPSRTVAAPFFDGYHNLAALASLRLTRPLAPRAVRSLPLRSFFPEAQVLVARAPGFAVAMKGGHNLEQHNHNDVGSYSLEVGGVPVVGDAGSIVYTGETFGPKRYTFKMLGSWGHPVPVVGGCEQSVGRSFAGRVVKTDFAEARETFVLDLMGAYETPNVARLERAFVFDRKERTFSSTDSVRFTEPSAFSAVTIAHDSFVRGADSSHWQVTKAGRPVLDLEIRVPVGAAWHVETERIDNPTKISPERLAVVFDSPVREADVTFVFRPIASN